jgi:hypothetical protein
MTGKDTHAAIGWTCAFALAVLVGVSPASPSLAQEAPTCDPSDDTCLAAAPADTADAVDVAPPAADPGGLASDITQIGPPLPVAVEVGPPAPNLVLANWQVQVSRSGDSGTITGEMRNDGTGPTTATRSTRSSETNGATPSPLARQT